MIRFAKFPMHEGVAIIFAAVWEYEAQTNDSIITRQQQVASFTIMPKFSSSKYKAKVIPDECVDELDHSTKARLVGITSGSTNILLEVSKQVVTFHLNKQLEDAQLNVGI